MTGLLPLADVSIFIEGGRVLHHYSLLRRHLAAFVITAALASPAFAGGPGPGSAPASAAEAAIRIDNFGRVNERYYRGAQPDGQDLADLARLGVKTTIDLTNGDGDSRERQLAEAVGMRFVKIAMSTRVVPTHEQITTFLNIVNDPASQPVYVHCVGGKHRTGVMTAIYRMVEDSWTPDRAFKEMKTYKFGADFLHPEFKKFVFAFKPSPFAFPLMPPIHAKQPGAPSSSPE
jgi:protein-tyrosine phosphatase